MSSCHIGNWCYVNGITKQDDVCLVCDVTKSDKHWSQSQGMAGYFIL